jgi:hypothetical protein
MALDRLDIVEVVRLGDGEVKLSRWQSFASLSGEDDGHG